MDTAVELAPATPSPPISIGKAFSPSKWGSARSTQRNVATANSLANERAEKSQQRASLIEQAFGGGFGAKVGGTSKSLGDVKSLLDCESGLLVAILSLFDANGSKKLDEEEWIIGTKAMQFETTPAEFEALCARYGMASAGELDFSSALGVFGAKKPVEGYIDELMRRFMLAITTLTLQVSGLGEQLAATRAELQRLGGREENARQARIQKVVRAWRSRHIVNAFDGWHSLVAARREALTMATRQWRGALAASVFRCWGAYVSDAKRQRDGIKRSLGRLRNRLLSAALSSWQQKTTAALEARRVALGRALGLWSRGVLLRVLDGWRGLCARAAAVRELRRRALLRLTHGALTQTFWAWGQLTAIRSSVRRQLLARAGSRLRNRFLVVTFDAWRRDARGSADARRTQQRRALAHFVNRLAAVAWDAWRGHVARRRAVLARAAFALGAGRLLALGFRSWVSTVREAKRAADRRWVVDSLAGSHSWLLTALGEVLPALLPEGSAVLARMRAQLGAAVGAEGGGGIKGGEGGEGGEARLRVHTEVERARLVTFTGDASRPSESITALPSEPIFGLTERTSSEAGVQEELVRLVRQEGSPAGARLLALAHAWARETHRWEIVARQIDEACEASFKRCAATEATVSQVQRFVTEQTKAYLGAAAANVSSTREIGEGVRALQQRAAELGARLERVEDRLETETVTPTELAALSTALGRLDVAKAGRDEVRKLVDHVQRPAVVVASLGHGTQQQPPTELPGAAAAAERSGQRPRSAAKPTCLIPGGEFGVVGKDGFTYRGQEHPTLTYLDQADTGLPGGSGFLSPHPPGTRVGGTWLTDAGSRSTPRPHRAAYINEARHLAQRSAGRNPRAPHVTVTSKAPSSSAAARTALESPSEHATPPAHLVATFGPEYAICRKILIDLEDELRARQDAVTFVFEADGTGDETERAMLLRYVAAAKGWAFHTAHSTSESAAVALSLLAKELYDDENHAVSSAPSSALLGAPPIPPITSQCSSLAEFISLVERSHAAFLRLVRIEHAGTVLWRRVSCTLAPSTADAPAASLSLPPRGAPSAPHAPTDESRSPSHAPAK